MSDLAALTASLAAHYAPPAAPPPLFTRTYVAAPLEPLKSRGNGYSPAPAGGDLGSALTGMPLAGIAGDSSRQRIRRPGTDRDATFKPKAEYYANHPVPATARVPRGNVSRVQVPGKLTRKSDDTGQTVMRGNRELYATFDSADAEMRARAAQRYNLAVTAGETW